MNNLYLTDMIVVYIVVTLIIVSYAIIVKAHFDTD